MAPERNVSNPIVTQNQASVSNMKLSIVIPAYNEEKRIKNTLDCLADRFDDDSCEVIVVSESTDKTDLIVMEFSRNHRYVRLVTSARRLGKGGAFKKGFANSQGEIVMLLDSDLPVPVLDIKKLLSYMDKVDVAIASREVTGTKIVVDRPLARVFASKAFSLTFNALFDLNIKDTQCGCKAFRRKVLCDVLGNVESNGFEFDAELLFRAKRKGYNIVEVPVNWSYKADSKLNLLRDVWNMGQGVIVLWLKTRLSDQRASLD
jgi:glycosyltransferase involved in cell wall biosynthesis